MLDREPVRASLRVIDGGSPAMRRDEAKVEYIAAIHEGLREANRIHVAHAAATAANRRQIRQLTSALREVMALEPDGPSAA